MFFVSHHFLSRWNLLFQSAFLLMYTFVSVCYADIFVIVNPKNSAISMTKNEVSALYLGRYQAFQDGSFSLPFDHPADSQARADFYRLLTDKNIEYINAYWARILFAGQATPPRQLKNDAAVASMVRQNASAIGYVSDPSLLKDVKVVLTLHE